YLAPPNIPGPVPAPRHAGRFNNEPLPTPPSFNEQDVSDKPAAIRKLPLLTPQAITEITQYHRLRLESLLAVDEGVAKIIDGLSRAGELNNTFVIFASDNGFLEGEHRLNDQKLALYEPSIR